MRIRSLLIPFVVTVVLLELVLSFLLPRLFPRNLHHRRAGLPAEAVVRELRTLYRLDDPSLALRHPYRWFTPQPDFQGEYFQTDAYGFRIDRRSLRTDAVRVGFFGGSIMFSTNTLAAESIPGVVEREFRRGDWRTPTGELLQALNYGVGYYSSSADLMTFMEALRRDGIRYALMYEGVNEVYCFAESLQSQRANRDLYQDVFGFVPDYWTASPGQGEAGRERLEAWLNWLAGYSSIFQAAHQIHRRMRARDLSRNANLALPEDELPAIAQRLAAVYRDNARTVQGIADQYGVRVLFVWQPCLFSGRKTASPSEQGILADPSLQVIERTTRALRPVVCREMAARPELDFFDGTGLLDGMGTETVFTDWCHINDAGNEVVALALMEQLRQRWGLVPATHGTRSGHEQGPGR